MKIQSIKAMPVNISLEAPMVWSVRTPLILPAAKACACRNVLGKDIPSDLPNTIIRFYTIIACSVFYTAILKKARIGLTSGWL
jgi:hypothetical protein